MTPTRQELEADYAPYTDSYGYTQEERGFTGGNGLLYSAEKVAILSILGLLTGQDQTQLYGVRLASYILPGLYSRHPTNTQEQEKWDDYYGLTAAMAICGHRWVAADVLKYGLEHWGCWDNVVPGRVLGPDFLGRFFGRSPHFWGHLYLTAGVPMPRPIFWGWSYWLRKQGRWQPDSQDSWVMSWLGYAVYRQAGGPDEYGAVFGDWRSSFLARYPGGLGQLLEEYFKDKGHPNIKYAKLLVNN